jgi:DNA modification methylase
MSVTTGQFSAADFVPGELAKLENVQTAIPAIAKDTRLVGLVEEAVKRVPTSHDLCLGDARAMKLEPESVHLVLTSPPYWTLKQYGDVEGQLGHVVDYETFLGELDKVWKRCFRALTPGGRLICVVGDVCLSRRKNNGRHTVIPLHASIQEHCRQIGFDNLAPIIWHKIANAVHEVENGSPFLGKPYEPNAVIKNDIEFILMERKPGGYRQPSVATRILSVISDENHKTWFQQIWMGVTGASTKNHPAPYPLELAERLIRMFSFVGDTVLDPFLGTGTTTLAAMRNGRNSIGYEIDKNYLAHARKRIKNSLELFSTSKVNVHEGSQQLSRMLGNRGKNEGYNLALRVHSEGTTKPRGSRRSERVKA